MAFERKIALHTLEGVKNAQITTHYFDTEDKLGLSMLRFLRAPSDDVVVVIHGLTTSSDMFIMPEHYNLVSYLHDNGFTDVFTLDFRMSNRHSYNLRRHRYTLDDCALYDHPKAIEEIKRIAGAGKRIHVICHCLGAASFVMSLFAGLVPDVTSVAANSVALTPRFEKLMYLKAMVAPFLVEYLVGESYLDPRWSENPGITGGKLMSWVVSLFHRECDNPACHMLSMMWGAGNPALYRHENLLDVTHDRGGDLYGGTGIHYQRHVTKMANFDGGHAIKYSKEAKYDALPDDYLSQAAAVRTPILFMTGRHNHVFTDSNIVCYERLNTITPGLHELKVYETYGHQDVFMGKDVATDIFPSIVEFFRKHGA